MRKNAEINLLVKNLTFERMPMKCMKTPKPIYFNAALLLSTLASIDSTHINATNNEAARTRNAQKNMEMAKEKAEEATAYAGQAIKEEGEVIKDKVNDVAQKGKQKGSVAKEKVQETSVDVAHKAQEVGATIKEKASNAAHTVAQKGREVKDKVQEVAIDVTHKAQDAGSALKDKASNLVHKGGEKAREIKENMQNTHNSPLYTFTLPNHNGGIIDLADYKGKVIMLVNIPAGYEATPELRELEALHQRYAPRGLVIIAVASDDFGNRVYGARNVPTPISFLRTTAVHVVNKKRAYEACPLYKWLNKQTFLRLGSVGGDFHKFIIGRDGELYDWFAARTALTEKKVAKTIEKALAR